MLRASSLGLCPRCLISPHLRAVRPFTLSAYFRDENDGKSSMKRPSATFTLPPSSQRKPHVFLGYHTRKGARALGLRQPAGFERLAVRQNRKPKPTPQTKPERYITESPYHVGRPWRLPPIQPVTLPSLPPPSTDLERAHHSWIRTLQSTQYAIDAWAAYSSLLAHPPAPDIWPPSHQAAQFALLHRLVRLLARQRPPSHATYMRLLALLSRLRAMGGTVRLHEWNALIAAAGSQGVRCTTAVQYEASLSFFRDMTNGCAPGTTLELGVHGEDQYQEEGGGEGERAEPVQPDVYTYTTLINIAARTGDVRCVRHARALLERSGIPPNRFTHLALTKYFMATQQPAAVRSTLLRMEQQDLELGIDGINSCLLAYSYNDRLDVVMMIYRLLRHNTTPEAPEEEEGLEEARQQLRREECIEVPGYLRPNEVTYTSMVQIMAYHGHLTATLTVFVDMISAQNVERGAPLVRDAKGELKPTRYKPTMAMFRATFLGFRRHGLKLPKSGVVPAHLRTANPPGEPGWTLDNLEKIFEVFIGMPENMQFGPSAFYWLIVAFQKTSGDDVELVRRVWKQVEGRFKGPWGHRLRQLGASLFPGEGYDGAGRPGRPS